MEQALPENTKKIVDPAIQKRNQLEELCKRRFFFTPAYEIYGGVKGLYDYGPPGSAMISNLTDFWREFFILEENMLQISTSSLTPEVVFIASGHVDKFEDNMVKDLVTGDCHRADHLLEDALGEIKKDPKTTSEVLTEVKELLRRVDDLKCHELGEQLKKYKVKAPVTGNDISEPFPFNLMFSTQIGPTGKLKGYMRPETAQGMFVNFSRLLDFNFGKLPFAAAQIGPAYRNEISPRSGLLRVREFTLAEIEHFVDPANKDHPKFDSVKDHVIPLFSRSIQLSGKPIENTKVGEAVEKGIINNQTLGYFLARVHKFLIRVGVKPDKIRFRQHLQNEMAHYACDCWDAEIKTSYGWVECVGNADRACYDLAVHEKMSGKPLQAFVNFADGPKEVEISSFELNKPLIGPAFKGEAKKLFQHVDSIKDNADEVAKIKKHFDSGANDMEIVGLKVTKEMVKFSTVKKRVAGKNIQPSVIEPSFGLGRITYCLLEHAYYTREVDEARSVLSLKPIIAPFKAGIFPLINDDKLNAVCNNLVKILTKARISNKLDATGVSIGRRYARTDELGCPFGLTADFDGLKDNTVTLRDRDSVAQVRVKVDEIAPLLRKLIEEELTWEQVYEQYPKVTVLAE